MSSTLILPNEQQPMNDINEIYEKLKHTVGMIVDGGYCHLEPTTVVDLSDEQNPMIARHGRGVVEFLE